MKIALIFTGGTIGSADNGGYISPSADKKYALTDGYNMADFDIFEPYTILSENLNGSYVSLLIKTVGECLKKGAYNGIIIMHGTDTLQYAAAAVSYAFGLNTVPIMFVSSNYILSDSRANGKANFKYAWDFIRKSHGPGTFISYQNSGDFPKIHRASRVLSYAQYSDRIESLGGEFGHYENDDFIKNSSYIELPDEITPFGEVDFEKKSVLYLRACPDISLDTINSADAVLLETYHSGTAAEKLLLESKKPVFILGVEDRLQYESVKAYERENVTILKKAAAPAMYMKIKAAVNADRLDDVIKSLGGDVVSNL